MPDYRRFHLPGSTVFLTIVTHERAPIFGHEANVARLREAIRQVMQETPFQIPAAVVLPDHMHFLWSLPQGDADYSRRVGRMKVAVTQSMHVGGRHSSGVSRSREKHRESEVWQRRFWEHTIRDEDDFERHVHYIHYNPVKHGYVACPHLWPYSSFARWVRSGLYDQVWGCRCDGRIPILPAMAELDARAGE
jgi:REP-associated tyrosine transposase